MNKKLKNILISLLLISLYALLIIIIYALYVLFSYSRIPDNVSLEISNQQSEIVERGTTYTALTYNVGFASYSPSYSFFMDTAIFKDGKESVGYYGKGISEEDCLNNTIGMGRILKELNSDFILLQEVDTAATRSFNINMKNYYDSLLSSYNSVFALNFHSSWLNLPLYDPHGIVNAGLSTLSKYKIEDATRYSYPVTSSITKVADLDRCFSTVRYKVEDNKELVIVNNHMSAYDKGGVIRKAQLELLSLFLIEEYQKGNYVIVGGDFNHALGEEYITNFPSMQETPDWVSILNNEDLPLHYSIVKPENGFLVPSVRSCDTPYTVGINYTTIVDGFIVSDNIKAKSIVIDTNFAYSDHQPVLLYFSLN